MGGGGGGRCFSPILRGNPSAASSVIAIRAPLNKQGTEDGAMTAGRVGTITTEGKVGLVRERGKEVEGPAVVRVGHFAPVLPLKGGPLPFAHCVLR